MKTISRKEFMSLLPLLGMILLSWLWFSGLKRFKILHQRKARTRYSVSDGPFIIKGNIIFTRENGRVRAFDARCTHLSCHLNLYPDGRIVCPCHGSEFNKEGKVLRGPAKRSLTELPINYDNTRKDYYAEIIMDE